MKTIEMYDQFGELYNIPENKMSEAKDHGFSSSNPNKSTGLSGVFSDIGKGISEVPSQLVNLLKSLPSEIYGSGKQSLIDPQRFMGNIASGVSELGRGIANTPSNISRYLEDKNLIKKGNPVSNFRAPDFNIPETFGVKGYQKGDQLLQSIGFAPLGAIGEIGSLGRLGRMAARSGTAAAGSIGKNESPIESILMNSLLGGSLSAYNKAPDAVKNSILNQARREGVSGASFTSEQANKNLLKHYIGKEGNAVPVDIGTLINSPSLKTLYSGTSSVPFSGGAAQKNKVRNEIFDKEEEISRINHERNEKEHATTIEEILRNDKRIDEDLNLNNELKSKILGAKQNAEYQAGKSNDILNSLQYEKTRTPEIKIKQELSNLYKEKKKKSEELYKPVNDSEIDLKSISKKEDFSRYNDAYEKFKPLSRNLSEIFGNDKDIGIKLSSEIKKAENFIQKPHEEIKLNTALSHIKNLQSAAAQAKESGNRTEAMHLNKMASGLKSDIKDILYSNGHEDIAQALEKADLYHREEIIPFYENREIRKSSSEKSYIPDVSRLSNALHDPNFSKILNNLPNSSRKSLLFEKITGKKYTPGEKVNFSPEEISKGYRNLKKNDLRAFNELDTNLKSYFDQLKNHINMINTSEKTIKDFEKREGFLKKEKDSINKKIEISNEKLNKSKGERSNKLDERYKKPSLERQGIVNSLKNLGALGALGAGAYLSLPSVLAGASIGIPSARKLNKFLTSDELREKFIKGGKFKKENKNSPLSQILTQYAQRG